MMKSEREETQKKNLIIRNQTNFKVLLMSIKTRLAQRREEREKKRVDCTKKEPKYSHTKRDINLAIESKVYNLAIHLVEIF